MADLFVISTGDYDLILGMTWLSKHHAMIDCRNRTVTFRIPGQPKFQFVGKPKATRQKDKGKCITMAAQEKLTSLVDEFPDVFEEPGFPPEREVEFTISQERHLYRKHCT